jgi:hypothetical protein
LLIKGSAFAAFSGGALAGIFIKKHFLKPFNNKHLIFNNKLHTMKRFISVLLLLFPLTATTQQSNDLLYPFSYLWSPVGTVGFTQGGTINESLAICPLDGSPYLGFSRSGSDLAAAMKFNGSEWITLGGYYFSQGKAFHGRLAISPADNKPYYAFSDGANSNKATVMKFEGSAWVTVGITGFSTTIGNYLSLAFNPAGEPFVAYQEYVGSSISNKATVMKFNGTNWVIVGNAGFSSGYTEYESLAISPTGEPYIAYEDWDSSQKASVMKFDGTNWIYVGSQGFSANGVQYTCLAFSPSGEPYIAFNSTGGATVMRYNGSNWVNVGNEGFSSGPIISLNLAFNPSGEPYVGFYRAGGATVMKFDGSNWVYVGTAGFSAGSANYLSLAINSSGVPYVGYSDGANGLNATVMKYDSIYVGVKENSNDRIIINPNPAEDMITIEIPGINDVKSIKIINLTGQLLYNYELKNTKSTLDISRLSNGMYFLKINLGDSVLIKRLMVKK